MTSLALLVLAGLTACSPGGPAASPPGTSTAVAPAPAGEPTRAPDAGPPGKVDGSAPAAPPQGETIDGGAATIDGAIAGPISPRRDAESAADAGVDGALAGTGDGSAGATPPPALGPFPLAGVQAAKPLLFAGTSARVEGPSWRAGDVFFAADGLGLMRADGQGKVFRYQPTLSPIGSFALGDGSLLVCEKQHVLLQIFADGTIGVLVEQGAAASFCNDITVDGAGNIYFSDSRAGSLMKLTPAGDLTRYVSGRKYPNGLEVDRDNQYLYFSDTGVNTLFRVPMNGGAAPGPVESLGGMIADGMAIDAWGNLWLAQVTAGQAMVYDPGKRQIIARVDAGGPQATNLTFGGPNHDALFTSVAGKGIMRIPVGVRGFSHPGAARYTVKSMLDLPPVNTPVN